MRLSRLLACLALIVLSACLTHPQTPADPGLASVAAKAVTDLQPVPSTGVAVAILQNNEVTYLGGFGLRDRERNLPVDHQTIFGIGSATKAFTSMGISMLAEGGLVTFDTPIRNYLPDFKMKDPAASEQMTLRDVLSHQSGLPRHDGLWYLGPFSQPQLFYRFAYLDPNPRPGFGFRRAFEYNNMMYMTAGYLQETLTGESWHTALRRRIFVPLDMWQSSSSIEALAQQGNTAKGYVGPMALPLKDLENIAPAGAINANAVDMARWVALHLRRGLTANGTRIISEAGLEGMYTSYVQVQPAGEGVGYGLGWFVARLNGQRILFHQGHTDGYSAYVSFMPEARLGVVVLTNQHRHGLPDRVAARMYSHLLNAPIDRIFTPEAVTLEPSVVTPETSMLKDSASVPSGLDDYTGRYANDGYGAMTVRRIGDELHLSYYRDSWLLHPVDGQQYYFDLRAYGTDFRVPVRFGADGAGRIDAVSVTLEPKVAPIRFAKR